MGADVDFNPRFVSERLIDMSAANMGQTAENLHDKYPHITKEDADRFAVASQQKATAAWDNGVMSETVVPMAVYTDIGWRVADRDEFLRPETNMDSLAELRTPFRPGGRVTAGNSAGLTDGATAGLLASSEAAAAMGLTPKLRLVGFAYAGVAPELMGIGPIPATQRVLERAGITIDDVDLFELNEPFAVQVLTWCDGLGVAPDDPRLNPYGGAIAFGHPLAATGVRLIAQLAYGMRERGGKYGLTALCIGMGMGRSAPLGERAAVSDPVTEFKLNRVETKLGPLALVTMDNGEDYTKRPSSAAPRWSPVTRCSTSSRRATGSRWCSRASRSCSPPAPTSRSSRRSATAKRRSPARARGTTSSHESASCRSRPSPRSTAPAWAAESRSR